MPNFEVSSCAHCGGQAKIGRICRRRAASKFFVECLSCGISTRHYDSYQKAVEVWNRRPDDIFPDGLRNVYRHNRKKSGSDDESGCAHSFVNRDIGGGHHD